MKSPEPREETVVLMYELARQLFDDERGRGQALDGKASTFAGFTGATLTLAATLGARLFETNLGSVGDVALRATFSVSVLALAVASALSIVGVLRPRERLGITPRAVKSLGEPHRLAAEPIEARRSLITTLGTFFAEERKVNNRKAKLNGWAARALLLALAALTSQAAIVVIAA